MASVTSFEATDFTQPAPPKAAVSTNAKPSPASVAVQKQALKAPPAQPKTSGFLWGAVAIGVLYALLRGK